MNFICSSCGIQKLIKEKASYRRAKNFSHKYRTWCKPCYADLRKRTYKLRMKLERLRIKRKAVVEQENERLTEVDWAWVREQWT